MHGGSERLGVRYEYLDFADSLTYLKEYLTLRDSDPIFEKGRREGSIGIPCIVREDGTLTLSWEEFM